MRVGRKGDVAAPSGAARIDLTGKTVIPALIDAHSHIGYMKNLTSGPQNYTRENILDHMYRFAYFGVSASQAMVRTSRVAVPAPGRAAGREIPRCRTVPHGRPGSVTDRRNQCHQHAARGLCRNDRRRSPRLVQELAARKVKLIKTWVDDPRRER